MSLRVSNLAKRYGDSVVFERVSFAVEAGEFVAWSSAVSLVRLDECEQPPRIAKKHPPTLRSLTQLLPALAGFQNAIHMCLFPV